MFQPNTDMFAVFSDVTCEHAWTGGWSRVAGSSNINDWRWHHDLDSNGPSTPFTFLEWGEGQPNNLQGMQYYISLYRILDFNFNDAYLKYPDSCFLCECP